MAVITESFSLKTRGNSDIKDITPEVAREVRNSGLNEGIVTVFIPGSTAGITTIEFEDGVLEDLSKMLDRIIPENIKYQHNYRWGDGNGHSHVRSAMVGTSFTVPFSKSELIMGTWQQIVLIDFDNRPRKREIILQIIGE
ncbi:MAG: YjbQ family protein [Deltaproteobacteria bacterium]|nr:MAG: YjbQ family protein [Deltaproteobacteria bacterium]